eukprot:TRINITY_DN37710_c0_g1_i1.p1 TRINITY_DN37710_c0_g1~~TRINITY_DN37710_c0_g1_i1.p1  ORF type:complete len:226 (+),score=38.65 TRINITY_DN37710_c0_g1_i1:42-680(+)
MRSGSSRLRTVITTMGVKRPEALVFENCVRELLEDRVVMERVHCHAERLVDGFLEIHKPGSRASLCSSDSSEFIDIRIERGVPTSGSIDTLHEEESRVEVSLPPALLPRMNTEREEGAPSVEPARNTFNSFLSSIHSVIRRMYESFLSLFSAKPHGGSSTGSTPTSTSGNPASYVSLGMICLVCMFAARRLPPGLSSRLVLTFWSFSRTILI